MNVINTIHDANFMAVACSFIKGLLPGSMLFEDLIKHSPYDIAKDKLRAKRVFKELESQEKLAKKIIIIANGATRNMPKSNKRSFAQNM